MGLSCYSLDLRHWLAANLAAQKICCIGRRQHLLNTYELHSKITGWVVLLSHLTCWNKWPLCRVDALKAVRPGIRELG